MIDFLKKKLYARQRYSLYSQDQHERWIYFIGMFEGLFLSGTIALLEKDLEELFLWALLLFDLEDEYEKETGKRIPLHLRQIILEEFDRYEPVSA